MEKYKRFFLIGFQSTLEYRWNFFIGIIGVFFQLLIQYFIWQSIYVSKGLDSTVFGYSYYQMLTYALTAGFISRMLQSGFHYQISADIKSGRLSNFLSKPLSYSNFRIFHFLGEKIFHILLLGAISTVILIFASIYWGIQIGVSNILMLIIDFPFALLLNFLIFYCVSTFAFWFIEITHLFGVVDILVAIVSGAFIPLDAFGERAVAIFNFLPFTYTTYFITNILSGKVTTLQFFAGLQMQIVWITGLTLIAIVLWKSGTKKYVAIGG